MNSSDKRSIVNAPGFEDSWTAWIVGGLDHVQHCPDVEPKAVVVDEAGEVHVVPSRCVRPVPDNRHAAAYRKEWVTLTGRSSTDIYIPEALR